MKKILFSLMLIGLSLTIGAMQDLKEIVTPVADKLVLTIERPTLYRAGDFATNARLNLWKTSSIITKEILLVKVKGHALDEYTENSAPQYYPVEDILGYATYYKNQNSLIKNYSYTIKPSLDINQNTMIRKENPHNFMTLEEFVELLNQKKEKKVETFMLDRDGNIDYENLPKASIKSKSSFSIGSYKFDTSNNTNVGLYAKLGILAGIGLALYLKPSLFLEPFKYFFSGWGTQVEN